MGAEDKKSKTLQGGIDNGTDRTNQTDDTEERIKRRGIMMDTLNETSVIFVSRSEPTFDENMTAGIFPIADIAELDRISVWQNSEQEDGLHASMIYRWDRESGGTTKPTSVFEDVTCSQFCPNWTKIFEERNTVNGPASSMPEPEASIIQAYEVKSVLIVPVFIKNGFSGFVFFEDRKNERYFDDDCSNMLRYAAFLLMNAVMRYEIERNMVADIARRDILLQAVNDVAELLLTSKMQFFVEDVNKALGILAKAMKVGCVCLWRNYSIDGELHCSLEYEWMFDKQTRVGKPATKSMPFSQLPSWENMLSDRTCINALMSDLIADQGSRAQELLAPIKSILVVPVIINDSLWGFMGFDDFIKERLFTEAEESLMSSASILITNSIMRHEMLIELQETSSNLEAALGSANEANRIKSVFLANMSHEIRTPMNSIMGFAELARDDDISDKTKDYLYKISENADWMLHIINDILDISKIESGKIVLESIPFDVHDIYEHCKNMIMPKVQEKGLSLYCYAEPSLGKKLLGDPVRLRQIITNLLSNAVKFTNSGTIKMMSSVISSDNNTATVHFEVKDSGIGMSKDQIDKVFEPFVQADDNTTRKYSGTGLGLAITKNLVELMGGSLHVVSAIDVGSKFSFEIPFSLIEIPTRVNVDQVIVRQVQKPVFNAEILICEDNEMNQQVICGHLDRIGIRTVIAKNGQEGLDIVTERLAARQKPFDLIFMDIHMPVMDGLEAAAKMVDIGVKTPIVALTANVMQGNLEMYSQSGMEGYLGKPFSSDDLYKCLLGYFTPLNFYVADSRLADMDEIQLQGVLRLSFVKNNQHIIKDIKIALDEDDINLAHRLAHTLKNNAANINETRLRDAAATAEEMLGDRKNKLTNLQLGLLEEELSAVLEKYAPLIKESENVKRAKIVDEQRIIRLIEELRPMIAEQNVGCTVQKN
ncbi:MAG: ATP-binding protein [Oscillospiraceae bacterium]|nr:ATP-binding protein [Oscillospiraceae bacterium]